ncbi:hypothetical protein BLOT_004537 [Blomia tropicalis]|nr:hypothetical protein BLOT_004537 [Blomia tropicalis]
MNDKSNKIIRLAGLIHLRTIRNILNEDRVSRRRRRSMWTRKIYQEREAFGAHENLFREMELNDVESYRRYIRMDTSTFYEIAEAIRDLVDKEDLSTGCIVQGSMRQCSTDGVRSLGQVGSNSYSNEAKEVRENFCNYFNNDGQDCQSILMCLLNSNTNLSNYRLIADCLMLTRLL